MDLSGIVTAINTVGFPIFAFIVTIWFIKYMYDKNIEQHREDIEQHREDMEKLNKLTESVNNNTIAIAELTKQININENDNK